MPGARTPFVDNRGRVNPIWYRFLVDLYERTGGGATDKVDASAGAAETAQTAAETAQTAAETAQTAADAAQTYAESIDGGFTNEIQEIKFMREFEDFR